MIGESLTDSRTLCFFFSTDGDQTIALCNQRGTAPVDRLRDSTERHQLFDEGLSEGASSSTNDAPQAVKDTIPPPAKPSPTPPSRETVLRLARQKT